MPVIPELSIHFYSSDGRRLYQVLKHPRRVEIKSGFGAERTRCWLELYNEDYFVQSALGNILEVWINSMLCFWGVIVQRRIDSTDDRLTLYAEWDPAQEFMLTQGGEFTHQTATSILDELCRDAGLIRRDFCQHPYPFDKILITQRSLFPAIDLLAKLAGNWIWEVSGQCLRFRPFPAVPDHLIYLKPDLHEINLWQSKRSTPQS